MAFCCGVGAMAVEVEFAALKMSSWLKFPDVLNSQYQDLVVLGALGGMSTASQY